MFIVHLIWYVDTDMFPLLKINDYINEYILLKAIKGSDLGVRMVWEKKNLIFFFEGTDRYIC